MKQTTNQIGTVNEDSNDPEKIFDYKFFCSLFVQSSEHRYGTKFAYINSLIFFFRSHIVLLVDYEDNVSFYESRQTKPPKSNATNKDIENVKWEIKCEKFRIKS